VLPCAAVLCCSVSLIVDITVEQECAYADRAAADSESGTMSDNVTPIDISSEFKYKGQRSQIYKRLKSYRFDFSDLQIFFYRPTDLTSRTYRFFLLADSEAATMSDNFSL